MVKTIIKDNTVGGDIAAGDIIKIQPPEKLPLREKISELRDENLHDPNFGKYIKDLQHYINPSSGDQRDLKTKLAEADRLNELHEAEELKEEFTKLLVKNSLSEKAQEAYVHILAKIKNHYHSKVMPILKAGGSLSDVEKEILEIIEIIYGDLINTALENDQRKIRGMLYFLGGNCHIQWKY